MAVRNEQRWMVKRRRLGHNARIGQAVAQEVNEICFLLLSKPKRNNVGVDQRDLGETIGEVAATVIELHYLFQRQLSAVMEVGSS